MNKNFIPTPQDDLLRLESSVTKTATFNGTTLDLGAGFGPGGVGLPVAAVVRVTACDRANSDETYSFVLQESADDSTWTDAGSAVTVDVSGTTATLGAICAAGFLSRRYARVKLTAGGTTPSITYEAWLNPNVR